MRHIRFLCSAVVGVVATMCFVAESARADFLVEMLSPLPGHDMIQPGEINDAGQVVGRSFPSDLSTIRAFRYGGGTLEDLGAPAGHTVAVAGGINISGQIVGASGATLSTPPQAFLYSGGTFQSLGTLPGGTGSQATAISNLGQVVGYADITGGATRAFSYSPSTGVMTNLGVLPGHQVSQAVDVNSAGQVVGFSREMDGSGTRAFVWDPVNGMQQLRSETFVFDTANAINDLGQIVGEANFFGITGIVAFLYENGVMTPLGSLGGNNISEAFDINNLGQIVGETQSDDRPLGTTSAFLYENGVMQDLNDLILNDPNGDWDLTSAVAINDLGQIIGTGTFQGQQVAFLLTPAATPEPGSFVLLGLVGAGFAGGRLRRRMLQRTH